MCSNPAPAAMSSELWLDPPMSANPNLAASRPAYLLPLFLGSWAALIAIAPTLTQKLLLAAPAVLLALSLWTLQQPVRWIVCFLAAALLLPPLPVAWGDSGPHPSLFFAALGLLAGALWLERWRIPANFLNAALAAFWTLLLASLASAVIYSGTEVAAASLARVGLAAIASYVFLFTAYGPAARFRPFPAIRTLYLVAVIAALFACIDFYYQLPAPAGYGPQFVWLDSGVYRRAQGLFYEASTLGNFCAFFLIFVAVAFTR